MPLIIDELNTEFGLVKTDSRKNMANRSDAKSGAAPTADKRAMETPLKSDNKPCTEQTATLIPLQAEQVEQSKRETKARKAADALLEGIQARNSCRDTVAFHLFLSTKDTKAELIPSPDIANLLKIHEFLDKCPPNVRDMICQCIPATERDASETLIEFLGSQNTNKKRIRDSIRKGLPEFPKPAQSD